VTRRRRFPDVARLLMVFMKQASPTIPSDYWDDVHNEHNSPSFPSLQAWQARNST
jgi:hypothetical protein